MESPYQYKKLIKIKGITELEQYLLEEIYKEIELLQTYKDTIVKEVIEGKMDLKRLLELGVKVDLIQGYNGSLKSLKSKFWEKASVDTLSKICEGEVFHEDTTWTYSKDKQYLINKDILPDLKYQEYKANDGKSHIAKKLGAKIVQ